MLTAGVGLLCLIGLGARRLHLRVVGLHLRGRFAALLDHLRARARERRTRGEGQRDRYRRDCHELSHVLSPPSEPGWLWTLEHPVEGSGCIPAGRWKWSKIS